MATREELKVKSLINVHAGSGNGMHEVCGQKTAACSVARTPVAPALVHQPNSQATLFGCKVNSFV